ncbi:helix-turn-helix transcriptional regulator [Methyloligella sp. 2.7D]|uniref:helix-turn-helix domain-containing protein n=1 Tax=unclassified Methyloligella TaxID=2625955 RepID=UPI001ABAFB5E|nr:helix-turn-helix transcriptional regulator [Methyloligella sp. GL2]
MRLLERRLKEIDRDGDSLSGRPAPALAPEFDGLFESLGEVAEAVGSARFYPAMAECVAKSFRADRYLAIRYARFSRPEFLVNASMTEAATEDYLRSYYRIDPLLRMVRTGVERNVLTFDQLRRSGTDTLYYEAMYRTAEILDELVILLPTVGGIWTAICVDRAETLFDEREIDIAERLYPLLSKLHGLHVERCVFGWRGGYLDDSQIAFMMIDTEGHVALRNALWKSRVSEAREERIRSLAEAQASGCEKLDEGLVVHWETLDQQNAVAPGGKAYLLEEPSPGYVDLAENELVEKFAEIHQLTPKEKEIVTRLLKGQPPALIAEQMGLTSGTVRNHKHRLYNKLDITTERELFRLFFDLIIANR